MKCSVAMIALNINYKVMLKIEYEPAVLFCVVSECQQCDFHSSVSNMSTLDHCSVTCVISKHSWLEHQDCTWLNRKHESGKLHKELMCSVLGEILVKTWKSKPII